MRVLGYRDLMEWRRRRNIAPKRDTPRTGNRRVRVFLDGENHTWVLIGPKIGQLVHVATGLETLVQAATL
jgi:hypothetical protein